ncbi:hypothetical protein ABG768_009588, partial [Culter alburnus]
TPMLNISSSEEVDVESVDDVPPSALPAYEELLEVVTRAVEKLNIEWPVEKAESRVKSKLDERFLPPRSLPQRRGLPFFPDLHAEVSRSWKRPVQYRLYSSQTSLYSNI